MKTVSNRFFIPFGTLSSGEKATSITFFYLQIFKGFTEKKDKSGAHCIFSLEPKMHVRAEQRGEGV